MVEPGEGNKQYQWTEGRTSEEGKAPRAGRRSIRANKPCGGVLMTRRSEKCPAASCAIFSLWLFMSFFFLKKTLIFRRQKVVNQSRMVPVNNIHTTGKSAAVCLSVSILNIIIYTVGAFRKLGINTTQYIYAVFISHHHCVCPFRNLNNKKGFQTVFLSKQEFGRHVRKHMRRETPSRSWGRLSEASGVFGLLLSMPAVNTFSYMHALPDANVSLEFLEWNSKRSVAPSQFWYIRRGSYYTSSVRDIFGKYGLHNMSVTLDKWAETW